MSGNIGRADGISLASGVRSVANVLPLSCDYGCMGIGPATRLASGSQGIVNEEAIRNAVRNALQKSLNIQEVVPVGSRPPSRLTARKRVTVSMSTECAVPLLRLPSGGGSDDIVLKRGIGTSDNDMVLYPRTAPCAHSAQ